MKHAIIRYKVDKLSVQTLMRFEDEQKRRQPNTCLIKIYVIWKNCALNPVQQSSNSQNCNNFYLLSSAMTSYIMKDDQSSTNHLPFGLQDINFYHLWTYCCYTFVTSSCTIRNTQYKTKKLRQKLETHLFIQS